MKICYLLFYCLLLIHDTISCHPYQWWNDIKLCYKWRADGDKGQCGGGASPELCARLGSATEYYRDDTDGRGGGCRMQWGIFHDTAPVWFKQKVQLCYRWYADGNPGQCGGGAATELCAPIGQYTAEYRDDTDSRGGGCRMSWKIKVLPGAPVWANYLQLCYQWYPDGVAGQCGGGADKLLCAKANTWTPYYRDDTDSRGGGCWMSWDLTMSFE